MIRRSTLWPLCWAAADTYSHNSHRIRSPADSSAPSCWFAAATEYCASCASTCRAPAAIDSCPWRFSNLAPSIAATVAAKWPSPPSLAWSSSRWRLRDAYGWWHVPSSWLGLGFGESSRGPLSRARWAWLRDSASHSSIYCWWTGWAATNHS